MTTKNNEKQSLSKMLISRWEQIGTKLVSLAQEFPEEKYETAPVAGVRTIGSSGASRVANLDRNLPRIARITRMGSSKGH